MSEAGSLLSERMENAASAATDMMRLPLTFAGAGVVCMMLPFAVVALTPLLLGLALICAPLLVPLGFGLMVFGLGRAGMIATWSTDHPTTGKADRRRRRLSSREDDVEILEVHRVAPVRNGSLTELQRVATRRSGELMRQVGALVKHNVRKASQELSGEVEQHLHALQRELQTWAGANPNLKPYCHGHIGWLLRLERQLLHAHRTDATATGGARAANSGDRSNSNSNGSTSHRQRTSHDLTESFNALLGGLPPPSEGLTMASLEAVPLPEGVRWDELAFLLVPGLLTKWYPLYMTKLRADLKRLQLHVTFSRVDTDQPVRVNAARLRHEIMEIASQTGKRVVLLGHSKGAVDAAAALSLFPALCDMVAALVSLQGPHGGSAIAHDLTNTQVQKTVVLGALEKLLRGCKHAVLDLSFEARQEFLQQHKYPLERVPTLCVATCDRRPSQASLLLPLIEYVTVRYGEASDGLVCQVDSILPGSVRVLIDDMDHFGPAWGSFPATDHYDPARLWLACISLALRAGRPRTGAHAPPPGDASPHFALPPVTTPPAMMPPVPELSSPLSPPAAAAGARGGRWVDGAAPRSPVQISPDVAWER